MSRPVSMSLDLSGEAPSLSFEAAIVWLTMLVVLASLANLVALDASGAASADLIGSDPSVWGVIG